MKKISSKLKNLKKHKQRIIIFVLFLILISLFPSQNVYFYTPPELIGYALPEKSVLPAPPAIPINQTKNPPPLLSAAAVLVKDITSGVVLYSKNKNERLAPASSSKIMTALVSLNHYKLDDVLTVKTVITEGKTMGLVNSERMTAENVLYATLVDSANDAAYTLADNYPGGVENFVSEMNRVAKEMGLSNTHFQNPVGFDNTNQYTTASELAQMALVGLRNPVFTKMVGTKEITVSDVNYQYFHDLKNVNELLGRIPGVSGVKTGFTEEGGEILVSEVKRNDHRVLIVILKSADRFTETQHLMNWIFDNFQWKDINSIVPEKPRVHTLQNHYLPQIHIPAASMVVLPQNHSKPYIYL